MRVAAPAATAPTLEDSVLGYAEAGIDSATVRTLGSAFVRCHARRKLRNDVVTAHDRSGRES